MSLMLHKGADALSRADLCNLPVPAPQGPRHAIYPFHDYVIDVERAITEYGFQIDSQSFGVTPDHNRFFGLFQLALSTELGYAPMIGLRGAYDQSLSRGLSFGSRVFVCDNLAFTGDHVLSTKQTLHVEERIARLLDRTVGALRQDLDHQDARYQLWRKHELSDHRADALLTEILRRDLVPSYKAKALISTYDTLPFAEQDEDLGPSLWRLFNAVTHVIRPRDTVASLDTLRGRTIRLTALLDAVADVSFDTPALAA